MEGGPATHFTDEATEAWRGKESCPRSHSKVATEQAVAPQPPDSQILFSICLAPQKTLEIGVDVAQPMHRSLPSGKRLTASQRSQTLFVYNRSKFADLVTVTLLCFQFLLWIPLTLEGAPSSGISHG